MGLLDRLRPGRQERASYEDNEELSTAAPEPGEYADAVRDDDAGVIRPTTLKPLPGDWAAVPPIETTLHEMPLVVPLTMREWLPALRPPEKFLDELGHAVSSSEMAGMVEAVLTPITALHVEAGAGSHTEPAVDDSLAPLPLAPSDHHAGGDDTDADTMRLPEWRLAELGLRPSPASPPRAAGAAQGDQPSASPAGDRTAEAGGSAGLVGAEPIVVARVTTVVPEPAPPSPFTSAASPPELPLATIPSEPLSEYIRQALAEAEMAPPGDYSDFQEVSEPLSTSGLIGDRPLADASPVVTTLERVEPLPQETGAPVPPDLPLAAPAPSPSDAAEEGGAAGFGVGRMADAEGEVPATGPAVSTPTAFQPPAFQPPAVAAVEESVPAATPEPVDGPVAPVLARSEPVLAGPPPPAVPDESAPDTGAASPEEPLPLAGPPATDSGHDAPVLGEAAPIGLSRPLSPNPPMAPGAPAETGQARETTTDPGVSTPRPRAGLGAPLDGLPPTARSYDITSMSRSQQLEVQRALMRSNLGPQPRPALPPAAAGGMQRLPARAGAEQAVLPEELPLVTAQPLPLRPHGTMPDDLDDEGTQTSPVLGALPPLVEADGPDTRAVTAEPLEGAAVRTAIGIEYNMDLGDVTIDRSPQGAAEAHRIGARAFTSDDRVVIPRNVGTLNAGEGAALLAHELTHVAQRRSLGPAVPDESSVEGQALESQARQTEMVYNQYAGPPPSLGQSRAGEQLLPLASPAAAEEGPAPGLPLAAVAPLAPAVDPDAIAQSVIERLSVISPSGPRTEVFTAATQSSYSPSPAPVAAAGPVQRADASQPLPAMSSSPAPETSSLGTEGMERPSDDDLNNLSSWLYPLIRYRLKGELREERERAGLLTEHYRRW